jgi:hypothetical protein
LRRSRMEIRSPGFSVAGRLLLLLSALLVAITPWTEYFWDFDHFVQGGQDFELGLLSVLTVLSLVLVVWWHAKKRLSSIVSIFCVRSRLHGQQDASDASGCCALALFSLAFHKTDFPLHTYQPPLLI